MLSHCEEKKHLQQNILFRENNFWHSLSYLSALAIFQSLHSIRATPSLQAQAGLSSPVEKEGVYTDPACKAHPHCSLIPSPKCELLPLTHSPYSLFFQFNLSVPFCLQREGRENRERKWKETLFIEHQIDSVQTIIFLTVICWIRGNVIILFSELKGLSHTLTTKECI